MAGTITLSRSGRFCEFPVNSTIPLDPCRFFSQFSFPVLVRCAMPVVKFLKENKEIRLLEHPVGLEEAFVEYLGEKL